MQSNQSTPFSNHFLFYSIINFILVQQRFFSANNDPHFYECKEIVHKEPFNSIIKSTFCAFAFELDLQSVDWERFFSCSHFSWKVTLLICEGTRRRQKIWTQLFSFSILNYLFLLFRMRALLFRWIWNMTSCI